MKTFRLQWPMLAFIFCYALLARLLPYILYLTGFNVDPQTTTYPWNFSPLLPLCLFGGACFQDRRLSILLPLGVWFLGDLGIGFLTGRWDWAFYPAQFLVYGAFLLCVCLGFGLRKSRPVWKLGTFGFLGCTLFFLITNLGVWAFGSTYPKTGEGLLACYVAAIPFYRNSLISTAFFGALMFGPLGVRETVPAQQSSSLEQSLV